MIFGLDNEIPPREATPPFIEVVLPGVSSSQVGGKNPAARCKKATLPPQGRRCSAPDADDETQPYNLSMNESETPDKSRRGGVIGGVLLIVVALALVVAGRSPGGLSFGFGGSDSDATASSGPGVTEVRGVIGSEKRPFFDDPEVEQRLKELGFNVSVETSGSREIAEKQDLNAYDFAFPSSAPAAEKIKGKVAGSEQFEPFYSPMAIATFTPVVDVLTREGVVRDAGGTTVLDMNAYIDLAQSDKRWRDLGPEVASPRRVQISTTDIRTSNSAAMYLSILSWLFSERAPEMKDNVDQLSGAIIPFFSGQGYTSSSSAGPFADYLSKGIGAAPMVMIYEAQYLGEAMRDTPRLHADGQLVYPSPTVLAAHTVVGFTEEGKNLGRALVEDATLQELAARHGFRPNNSQVFADVMAEHSLTPPSDLADSIAPPSYDRLEDLITRVGVAYAGKPTTTMEEDAHE